jgi:hypothetical protein
LIGAIVETVETALGYVNQPTVRVKGKAAGPIAERISA